MYQCKSISTGETYERVSHLSQPLPWTCWHLLTSLKLNFIHDHAKWLLRRITYIIKSKFLQFMLLAIILQFFTSFSHWYSSESIRLLLGQSWLQNTACTYGAAYEKRTCNCEVSWKSSYGYQSNISRYGLYLTNVKGGNRY